MFELVYIIFLVVDSQRPTEDLITNLPGLNFATNYSQYSGYLDLNNNHHYHYWLTESQQNADTDPVVIWLNGGPGCSSVGDGLLYELGPFHVYPNGSLWDNSKYSWNNNANILYLESPVCVGFSYQVNQNQNNITNCSMNDNTTADDNYNAMLKFLDKFPVYKTNDWFVVGESYGGAYVPMLTRNILQGNKDGKAQINLKGFAVGNGITVREFNGNSGYWYQYHHGMISEEIWNNMLTNCCTPPYDASSCPFIDSTDEKCRNALSQANTNCCKGVNMYDIYGPCYHYSAEGKGKTFSLKRYERDLESIINMKDSDDCLDDRGSLIYLNEMDVWNALHIRSIFKTNGIKWNSCADLSPSPYWLNYTKTKYAKDMRPIYDEIFELDADIFMLIYHGDTDGVCNFLGGEWFVDNMNLTVTNKWREWYIQDENGRQVGGWTKDFKRGSGAHYATVRGSGHLVPQYAPVKALKLFQYFLANKDLD